MGSSDQWKKYDGEFHQALISNCGSVVLIETYAAVFDRYFRYQIINFEYRVEPPAGQHLELLECALNRDSKRAKEVLRAHISDCVEHAIAHWPQ